MGKRKNSENILRMERKKERNEKGRRRMRIQRHIRKYASPPVVQSVTIDVSPTQPYRGERSSRQDETLIRTLETTDPSELALPEHAN
jgi:hypothetical protein